MPDSACHAGGRGLRALTRFGITSRREEVKGQPGARFFDREDRLISVMSLDVAEGQIQAVNSIVNPDKLRHLGPLADLEALLRERSWILQLAGSSWIATTAIPMPCN